MRSNSTAYWTSRPCGLPSASSRTASLNAVRSQRSSSRPYIQNGWRCLIMKGSNGRSPWLWVRSWIMSHSTNASLAALLVAEHLPDVLGQVDAEHVDGRLGDAAETRRLAVAEDAAPGEALGDLADRDRLGEEHGRVGVVPGGEVLEGDAAEQRVVVAGGLQLREPLRPHHAQHDGFQVPVRCRSACTSGRPPGAGGRRPARRRGGTPSGSRGSPARRSRCRPTCAGRRPGRGGTRRRAAAAGERLHGGDDPGERGVGVRAGRGALGAEVDGAVGGLPDADLTPRHS